MTMPITIEGDEYLSTEEAMEFLGVSRTTLLKVVREQKIAPKKKPIGRTLYYPKKRLAELLKFQDVEPESDEE